MTHHLQTKNFKSPDEVREFVDKGKADILMFGDDAVGRGVFEPGWHWEEHIGPIAGTDSCEVRHFGYIISGRMHVKMDDGEESDLGPGDVFSIEPGHDAWVVGNEPCEMVDFGEMQRYAK